MLFRSRLFVSGSPAPGFPSFQPTCDTLPDVFAVKVEVNQARAVQGLQGLDDGLQFHAIVGGVGLTAAQTFFCLAVAHVHTPSTGAGVAFASAIGVDGHTVHE